MGASANGDGDVLRIEELPMLLLRAAKAMTEEVRATQPADSNPSGLTVVHAFAMRFIAANEAVTTVEVAQHLGMTKQSASEIVCALERDGYLTRRPHPNDGRARTIELTAEGRVALAASQQRWTRVEKAWEDIAGADELGTVRRALESYLADRQARTRGARLLAKD
jgi:DNA-binding MarR family transcriptional regulator